LSEYRVPILTIHRELFEFQIESTSKPVLVVSERCEEQSLRTIELKKVHLLKEKKNFTISKSVLTHSSHPKAKTTCAPHTICLNPNAYSSM
jgi:hypothetical protein